MELFIEPFDGVEVHKVDEPIALVGSALGVARKVEEVVVVPKILVDLL